MTQSPYQMGGPVPGVLAGITDAGTARADIHTPALAACQAVAIANVSLSVPGATFGGFTLTNSGTDQVLLTAQTTASQNGPWVWNGASSALTRPTDYGHGITVKGRTVQINNGSGGGVDYDQTIWILATNATITVDTTATTWSLAFTGTFVPLTITTAGAPTTGTWATGSSVIDEHGLVWNCTAGGTPGTWVQASSGAGTYVPLAGNATISGGLGIGGFSVVGRSPFGQNAVIDSSDTNTAYDWTGSQFNAKFTGQNWQSTTAPDNGFVIGASFFTNTGSASGDGNGIPTFQAMEVGIQSDASAATPPSAAPYNSAFNIRYMQALQLSCNLSGSSLIYSAYTLYVQPPTYASGVSTTRAVADGVITGTTTLTSATANFTSADNGVGVHGQNIAFGTTLTYVNSTTCTLSQAGGNGTGLSINIGNGGSVLSSAYGVYISGIDGQAVGSTNTYALFSAKGNNYLGGPLSLDLTQMTATEIGLNPSQMASRSGVLGAVAALNIKVPNPTSGYSARLIDVWGPVTGNSAFSYFAVTGAGAVVAASGIEGAYIQAGGLTGATSTSRYVGATASGAPVSGTFAVGDFVIDQTGTIWICTTAGTPGTWTGVGSSSALPLAGGTMSGAIAMGANKITGLANGTASTDAAAFGQIPTTSPIPGFAFQPGRWYPQYATVGTPVQLTQNTLYTIPFLQLGSSHTFTAISCPISTAGTGGTVRLGIYADTGAIAPGALIEDFGTVAATSTGVITITSSVALAPGLYWLGVVGQGGTVQPFCQVSSTTFPNAYTAFGVMGTSGEAGTSAGYTQTGITGGLPSPYGVANVAIAALSALPVVQLKA